MAKPGDKIELRNGRAERAARHRREEGALRLRQADELELLVRTHAEELAALERRHQHERWAASHPPPPAAPKVQKGRRLRG